jgi:hypothetical protein
VQNFTKSSNSCCWAKSARRKICSIFFTSIDDESQDKSTTSASSSSSSSSSTTSSSTLTGEMDDLRSTDTSFGNAKSCFSSFDSSCLQTPKTKSRLISMGSIQHQVHFLASHHHNFLSYQDEPTRAQATRM